MRIMRGLSSRVLTCGCLAGLYETYDGEIVGILDARDPSCTDPGHQPGAAVSRRPAEAFGAAAGEQPSTPPSDRR